jgi:anaerobic magnesium-protoporphyrin IX monomethyl ester cyclase
MREAALSMISMARERGRTVIVCGSDATDHPGLFIEAGADFVLLGEGEATLLELLDRLKSNASDVNELAGLAWRERVNGGSAGPIWRANPRRPVLRELDSLPFPAWDLADIERYRRVWMDHHGYFSLNMVTTRGCPYHCNWCAKPIWGQRYSVRSPSNVVQELHDLSERYAPDHIWFMDDILGLQPGWMESFADRIEEHGLRVPFKSLNRADLLLRGDTIGALRRAGAQTVWIGAESGSQKILDAMEKGVRVEQISEATRRLRQAGIRTAFFLQFGYPGETRADIGQTLRLVRECQPDDIGISVSYPLPGTKFHDTVKSQLGPDPHWHDSSDLAMLYRGPFPTGFYRTLHRVVHHEFRARRAWRGIAERLKFQVSSLKSPAPGWEGSAGDHNSRATHHHPPPFLTTGHWPLTTLVRTLIINLALLPLARLQLEIQARLPHRGLEPITPVLTLEQAASPSPQPEAAKLP